MNKGYCFTGWFFFFWRVHAPENALVTSQHLQGVDDEVGLCHFLGGPGVGALVKVVIDGIRRQGPQFPGEHLVQLEPQVFVQICRRMLITFCQDNSGGEMT